MTPLVLWDVDGTLLRGGPAAREAAAAALSTVLGRAVTMAGISTAGRTERGWLREALTYHGVPEADLLSTMDSAIVEIAAAFEQRRHRLASEGVVLPGVPQILRRLAEYGALQTLVTGNVRHVGGLKVSALGLDPWLDLEIGAYGCEHHDRGRLVSMAIRRAAGRLGREVSAEEVWVIGDTPHDYACAAAAGVRSLLVATGQYPLAELENLGADAVLPDLSDVDGVLRTVVGNPFGG